MNIYGRFCLCPLICLGVSWWTHPLKLKPRDGRAESLENSVLSPWPEIPMLGVKIIGFLQMKVYWKRHRERSCSLCTHSLLLLNIIAPSPLSHFADKAESQCFPSAGSNCLHFQILAWGSSGLQAKAKGTSAEGRSVYGGSEKRVGARSRRGALWSGSCCWPRPSAQLRPTPGRRCLTGHFRKGIFTRLKAGHDNTNVLPIV